MLFYANERIFMDIVTLSSEPFYEIPVSFYEIHILYALFETQVRFTSNALAFNLKCTCVLIKTYLRLRGNVLAFERKRTCVLRWQLLLYEAKIVIY